MSRTFQDNDDLVQWIRESDDAKLVRQRLALERQYVVVECASDGWISVFGSDRVSARVVVRPHSENIRLAQGLDEYVSLQIPRTHRSVYWPGCIRATGQVEKLTLQQVADRQAREAISAVLSAKIK